MNSAKEFGLLAKICATLFEFASKFSLFLALADYKLTTLSEFIFKFDTLLIESEFTYEFGPSVSTQVAKFGFKFSSLQPDEFEAKFKHCAGVNSPKFGLNSSKLSVLLSFSKALTQSRLY
ncbi:MAG: hypothetical protein ACTTJC_04750 [Campylobacter sp.]